MQKKIVCFRLVFYTFFFFFSLKDTVKELEETNQQLDNKVKNLHTMLETERKKNEKKQNKVRTIPLVFYIVLSLMYPKSLS